MRDAHALGLNEHVRPICRPLLEGGGRPRQSASS